MQIHAAFHCRGTFLTPRPSVGEFCILILTASFFGSLLIGQCISTQIGYRSTPFPQLHILCQVHRFLPPTVRFRHQMSVEIQEEMLSRFQRLTSILSQGHRYGRNGPK